MQITSVLLLLSLLPGLLYANVYAPPLMQTRRDPISIPLRQRASSFLGKRDGLSNTDLLNSLQAGRDSLIDKFIDSRGKGAIKRIQQKRAERDDRIWRAKVERRQELEEGMQGEERTWNCRRDQRLVPMTNHNFDTVYSGVMNLGTPPTAFDVILDTGSSDTWVPNITCTCSSANCGPCSIGKQWDPTSSSTFSQRGKVLQIIYGSGRVLGSTGLDVVELGGFTINDQVIGVVNAAARVLPGDVSGLMGLAFGYLARSGGTPWWLRVFAGDANETGGTIDEPVMGFWFSRYINSTGEVMNYSGGQMTLGGTNTSLYTGDINYIDVVKPAKWWVIPLEQVGLVDGPTVDVDQSARQAIIDTGTTLVGGQDTVLELIYASIPGSIEGRSLANQLDGFYVLPLACNSTASVTLTFGGRVYPYSVADLLYLPIPTILEGYCISSLFVYSSSDPHSINYTPANSPYWLVGDAFLKNVYSAFHLGDGGSGDSGIQGMGNNGATAQVGFATLSGLNGEVESANENEPILSASEGVTHLRTPTSTSISTDPVPIGVGPDLDTTVVVVVTAPAESQRTSIPGSAGRVEYGLGVTLIIAIAAFGAMW